jgi:hypothetical protein
MTKANIPAEFSALDILGDEEISLGGPDVLDKFFSAAALAGAIEGQPGLGFAHIEALSAETQERDARVSARYRKIAEAAAHADSGRLEKSARRVVAGDANDTRKIVRTETTRYRSGKMLVAEIGESGEVIRVLEEQGE